MSVNTDGLIDNKENVELDNGCKYQKDTIHCEANEANFSV